MDEQTDNHKDPAVERITFFSHISNTMTNAPFLSLKSASHSYGPGYIPHSSQTHSFNYMHQKPKGHIDINVLSQLTLLFLISPLPFYCSFFGSFFPSACRHNSSSQFLALRTCFSSPLFLTLSIPQFFSELRSGALTLQRLRLVPHDSAKKEKKRSFYNCALF